MGVYKIFQNIKLIFSMFDICGYEGNGQTNKICLKKHNNKNPIFQNYYIHKYQSVKLTLYILEDF